MCCGVMLLLLIIYYIYIHINIHINIYIYALTFSLIPHKSNFFDEVFFVILCQEAIHSGRLGVLIITQLFTAFVWISHCGMGVTRLHDASDVFHEGCGLLRLLLTLSPALASAADVVFALCRETNLGLFVGHVLIVLYVLIV